MNTDNQSKLPQASRKHRSLLARFLLLSIIKKLRGLTTNFSYYKVTYQLAVAERSYVAAAEASGTDEVLPATIWSCEDSSSLENLESAAEEGFQDVASLNIKLYLKLTPYALLKKHAGRDVKAVLLLESQSYAQLFQGFEYFCSLPKTNFQFKLYFDSVFFEP
jgi:hypothetical protein